MKTGYKFYFQDEPQFCSHISNRKYLANKLRWYRANRAKYRVTKTPIGYQVTVRNNGSIGIFERF
jgi:hypothetical protein